MKRELKGEDGGGGGESKLYNTETFFFLSVDYIPIVLSLFTFHDRGPSCTILLLVRSKFWGKGKQGDTLKACGNSKPLSHRFPF